MSINWNGSCSELGFQSRNSTSELWVLEYDNWFYSIVSVVIIFILIGFTWNVLVVAAIFTFKLHKKPTFMLLLSLVAVDMVWCFNMGLVDLVTVGFGEFIYGRSDYERCISCKLFVMLNLVFSSVSIMLLGLIGLERLVHVQWPLQYGKVMTIRNLLVVVAVIWLVCTLTHLPVLLGFGEVQVYKFSSCKLSYPESSDLLALSGSLHMCAALFIVVCNVWILLVIYKFHRAKLHRELQYASCKNVAGFQDDIKRVKKNTAEISWR